ncbi:hypothetical protein GCM10009573_15640 [Agromyces bracchium]
MTKEERSQLPEIIRETVAVIFDYERNVAPREFEIYGGVHCNGTFVALDDQGKLIRVEAPRAEADWPAKRTEVPL